MKSPGMVIMWLEPAILSEEHEMSILQSGKKQALVRIPWLTSCAGSCTIWPHPCMPHAAAQLQPIHALRLRCPACFAPWIFMFDRQRFGLGSSVEYGVVHINYVVTWTANQSGLVTLTFNLESGVRVMCDMGYLPKPLCSQLRPNIRVRQTSDSIIA